MMTAITGGIVCFKPNIHRLLGLQNRCPTSWGFKDRIGFIVEEDMGIQRNWRRKLGLIRKPETGYSRSLCQSAICRRGELHTSFQWFTAEP